MSIVKTNIIQDTNIIQKDTVRNVVTFRLRVSQTLVKLGVTPIQTWEAPHLKLECLKNRSSYDHQTFQLFYKIYVGTFYPGVTFTLKLTLPWQPSIESHVLQNLYFSVQRFHLYSY